MKIELGILQKHGEFILNGEKYKILGISSYRSFNNIQCQNIQTKKRKWLDQATEVEVDEKEIIVSLYKEGDVLYPITDSRLMEMIESEFEGRLLEDGFLLLEHRIS